MVDGRLLTLQEKYAVKKKELAEQHKQFVEETTRSMQKLADELKRTEELVAEKETLQQDIASSIEEMDVLRKEHEKRVQDTKDAETALQERNNAMDEYGEYLKDLSGKITTRLREVNEKAQELNIKMEAKGLVPEFTMLKE